MRLRTFQALVRFANKALQNQRFRGVVDEISSSRVRGWAIDRRRPAQAVQIAVLLDGEPVAFGPTGEPRPDVGAHGFGSDTCGFVIQLDLLPRELLRSEITVAIWMNGRAVYRLDAQALTERGALGGRWRRSLPDTARRPDAGRATQPSILIEGPLKGDYSLSIVNRSFARALIRLGEKVAVTSANEDLSDDPYLRAETAVKAVYLEHADSAVFGIHSLNNWPPETGHMRAPFKALHCFAWEESAFPPKFVEQFNRNLDLICVTSRYTKETLENSGVCVPISVVGNGLDHVLRCVPQAARRDGARRGTFRFLHVSSCFPRKGADVLARAFVEEFADDSNVELLIKTFDNPHNEIEAQLRQLSGGELPRGVRLVKASIAPHELLQCYLDADCVVAPSRGEGFLLPAAEGMALGIPVIVTDAGGQADFCDRSTSWLVRSTVAPAQTHMNLANSFWFEPDVLSLRRQMRAVFEATPAQRAAKTTAARQRVQALYTWEKVARRFNIAVERRRQELASPNKRYRVALVSTWNQKCGIATYSQHIVDAAPDGFDIEIIGEDVRGIVGDAPNVARVWTRDSRGARMLCDHILRSEVDAVLIQHHVGLFGYADLQFILDALCQNGPRRLPVFLQLHTTRGAEVAMMGMATSLAKLSGLFVHTFADVEALPQLAQSIRVAVIAHGVSDLSQYLTTPVVSRAATGEFHIGAFGFCMPHKGVIEHIRALDLLRDRIPNLRATLLHAITDDPKTINYAIEVMDLIRQLNLGDVVEIDFRFLEMSEVIKRMATCDAIVFPYHANAESASGAVREVVGLGIPTLCTPISTFSDVSDICFPIDGFEPFDIADAIYDLYLNEAKRRSKRAQQSAYVKEHAWSQVSERIFNIIRAELRDLEMEAACAGS